MALCNQRVTTVCADVAVGPFELARDGNDRRPLFTETIYVAGQTKHRLAHTCVDSCRRAPYHPSRRRASDIDLIQHPRPYSQHFADRRWIQDSRVSEGHSHQDSVDIALLKPGVFDRHCARKLSGVALPGSFVGLSSPIPMIAALFFTLTAYAPLLCSALTPEPKFASRKVARVVFQSLSVYSDRLPV